MDNIQNRYLAVSYQLYTTDANGKETLEVETQHGKPFKFISGFGFSLDAFERHLVGLLPAEKFDFTLTPEEAFGPYIEEGVHKVDRDMFTINGKFDSDNVYPGAIITLTDADERRFMARVTAIDDDGVTLDTNHPLAGKPLHFTGIMLENRDSTTDEIQAMINSMSCDCNNCGGGCGNDGGCGGCGGCQ